ncbi:MAG: MOSC domain-containing protein [Gammaproteobacteria bacterium]|nr:MOSC domain-containing protein [Gammaproteobacteria bacterium]MDH4253215.1 MOSC domain-containing protein [Gammaproteobacteria bacterium]MDH5309006.1 MOSC domain-containing protein [Gammaproteobacteria bacterium]
MGRVLGIARRAGKRAVMETLESAVITTASGVAGDSRGRPGDRQVTLLSNEAWQSACADAGRSLPWTTRRANILVGGVELPQAIGSVIEVGDVRLAVTMETAPCARMDEQCEGLRRALQPYWRGGICCRVIEGGEIRLDSPVRVCGPD